MTHSVSSNGLFTPRGLLVLFQRLWALGLVFRTRTVLHQFRPLTHSSPPTLPQTGELPDEAKSFGQNVRKTGLKSQRWLNVDGDWMFTDSDGDRPGRETQVGESQTLPEMLWLFWSRIPETSSFPAEIPLQHHFHMSAKRRHTHHFGSTVTPHICAGVCVCTWLS